MQELIPSFAKTRLLCVGDVMLDRFVDGKVKRISPEAPVPVLSAAREMEMLGGAGNVARNATALGADVDLLAVVGRDDGGRRIGALASASAGLHAHLVLDPDRPTTVKTRFQAAGQQLLRVDGESAQAVAGEVELGLLEAATALLADCDVVVLSDYAKGTLTARLIQTVNETAQAMKKPVVVDPKSRILERYAGAAIITPNLGELEDAAGRHLADDAAIVEAATHVVKAGGFEALLVTRSEQGMTLVRADGTVHHQRSQAREVYDVAGAGDTVVATLALALGAGADFETAAALANAAAGVVVGKAGTATVSAAELLTAASAPATSPIRIANDVARAVQTAELWRGAGLKIGFTNGCFDLLHPGHLKVIDAARQHCDRLVVGLNSDASVARLKGEGRPVTGEANRAEVLAALRAVDLVVVFEEDTPEDLVLALQPDLIAKGGDYTEDEVVGADTVRARGGDVLLVPLVEGLSTTRTLARAGRG